jgi:ribosomal protein S18 acetylase RimI-like enzyme
MIIRRMKTEDMHAFWELRLQALRGYPEAFGSSYEEELHKSETSRQERFLGDYISPEETHFVLGAFHHEKLVGMVGFRQEGRIKTRHKGTVWGMFVLPEFHHKGVGKALMMELLDAVRDLKWMEIVQLWVVTTNESAIRLYELFGFKTFGEERHAIKIGGEYYDEYMMALMLDDME